MSATIPDPERSDIPAPPTLLFTGAEPDGEPVPQARVPGYDLLRELGRGGMGVVYLARQKRLNRLVALKMVLGGGHASMDEVLRFVAEAEAVAQLRHPNIVQVYEIGQHEAQPYFSLEYVEGGNLAQRIRGTPLPPREAAVLCRQLAEAMQHAHGAGIVHRDLKPANVLLSRGDREKASGGVCPPRPDRRDEPGGSPLATPKITDFGLAKRITTGAGLTQTGAIVGTPSYMAPEQAQGKKDITPAVDIYALGAILYETLTGRPPFQAPTPMETVMLVIEREPVPPSELQPGLPRDLETICLKCLHKEPARRYGSAAELADDLAAFLADRPIKARPVRRLERGWRWCRRNPVTASLLTVVALLLFTLLAGASVAALLLKSERDEAQNSKQLALEAKEDATDKLWGSYLAQARAGRLSRQSGQRFDSLAALTLAADIRYSLDLRNEAIACLALPDIRPAATLPPLAELPGQMALNCAFDENGNCTITHKLDGQVVARLPSADGKETSMALDWEGRYLAVRHAGHKRGQCVWIAWDIAHQKPVLRLVQAESDRWIWNFPGPWAFTIARDRPPGVHDLSAGKTLSYLRLPTGLQRLTISADGRYLASALENDLSIMVFDLKTGAPVTRLHHPAAVHLFEWHPYRPQLASHCKGEDRKTYLWDMKNHDPQATISGADAHNSMSYSGDGNVLAVSGWSGLVNLIDPVEGRIVLSINGAAQTFAGSNRWLPGNKSGFEVATAPEYRLLHRVAMPNGASVQASLSPDGRLLAATGPDGVLLYDVKHGSPLAVLPTGFVDEVQFGPRGDTLLTYGPLRGLELWSLRPVPRQPGTLRLGPSQRLGVIPAGRQYSRVAFGPDGQLAVGDWGRNRVVRVKPDGRIQLPELQTKGAASVAWSSDGRWIAAGTWHGPTPCVWNADTGKLVKEFSLNGDNASAVSFTPDGSKFILMRNTDYQVWRTGDWTLERTVSLKEPSIPRAMAFTVDGTMAALCDTLQSVKLLRPDDWTEIATLTGREPFTVGMLSFSGDGRHLAVTGSDRAVVWDLGAVWTRLQAMKLGRGLPSLPDAAIDEGPIRLLLDGVQADDRGPTITELPVAIEKPATPEQIAAWIKELSAAASAEAARKLLEAGEKALPAVQSALAGAEPSLRKRLELLRDRIQLGTILTPRRVALKFTDTPIDGALAALGKTLGLQLLYEGKQAGRVSVSLDAPAWQAIDRFCEAAELRYVTRDERTLVFSPGKPYEVSSLAYPGPFRLRPATWSYSRYRTIEPGKTPPLDQTSLVLHLSGSTDVVGCYHGDPRLDEVVDDRGVSLLTGMKTFAGGIRTLPLQLSGTVLQVHLKPTELRPGRLKVLKGVVPFELQVPDPPLISVPDIGRATSKPIVGQEGVCLSVRSCRQVGMVLSVTVCVSGPPGWNFDSTRHAFDLLDKNGRRHLPFTAVPLRPLARDHVRIEDVAWLGGDVIPWPRLSLSALGPGSVQWVGTLDFFGAEKNEAASLRLATFRRLRTELPFEFRDLPLP